MKRSVIGDPFTLDSQRYLGAVHFSSEPTIILAAAFLQCILVTDLSTYVLRTQQWDVKDRAFG